MERLGDILRRREEWTSTSSGRPPAGPGASAGRDLAFPEPVEGPSRGAGNEPRCPRCGGVGFVYPSLVPDDPDFGRALPCVCTEEELEAHRSDRLQRYSNLGPLLRMTFDSLVPLGRSGSPANQQQFQRALERARAYAHEPHGWLVLTGSSGSGKTHVAAAIANACIAAGRPALFMVVPDLLDHLRSAFGPQSRDTYDGLFEQVRNSPLLVLDDLGTQSTTMWAQEKLFQLLNHRYNTQLPTVVTIAGTLESLDERLRTRLGDPALSQVCPVEQQQDTLVQYQGALTLDLLASMTFRNFDTRGMGATPAQQESLRAAYRAALAFAENPEAWLVLAGPVGSGKTHLAAAVANYRLQQGEPVYFVVVPDLLDHLRSAFAPDSRVTYDALFEAIKTTPLLILDDLGTQSSSTWAQEKLFQLLNYRYNGRLPTVVTTNLSPTELHHPALASRLGDHKVSLYLAIDAPDHRLSERTPAAPAANPVPRRSPSPRRRM